MSNSTRTPYSSHLLCAEAAIYAADGSYALLNALANRDKAVRGVEPATAAKLEKALFKVITLSDMLFGEVTGRNFVEQPRSSRDSLPAAQQFLTEFSIEAKDFTEDDVLALHDY